MNANKLLEQTKDAASPLFSVRISAATFSKSVLLKQVSTGLQQQIQRIWPIASTEQKAVRHVNGRIIKIRNIR